MSEQEQVVRDFCAAWSKLDLDELAGYFTADAVYHNIPMDPVVGPDAIRAFIEGFTGPVERVEFEITHLASDGDLVLTERVDSFVTADRSAALPVMGAFELRDGKIAAWRDYFDMAQAMSALGLG
jgi:limonene-1,2-epoxide hydrolase